MAAISCLGISRKHFLPLNPTPFVPAWQLDKSPERSAVQESSTCYVVSEGGMASSGRAMTAKPFVSVSVVIPVELRQPRAKSLAVACDGSSLGEGISRRVNSARLMQPRKR